MAANPIVRPIPAIFHPLATHRIRTELAALTGMGNANDGSLYPGRDTTPSIRPYRRGQSTLQRQFDPTEDDPIDHTGSIKSQDGQSSSYVVAPSIQVRSEFPTITRTGDPNQPLTCIVVIELPGKRPPGSAPVPRVVETFPVVKPTMLDSRTSSAPGSPRPDSPPQYATTSGLQRSRSNQGLSSYTNSPLQEHAQNFPEPCQDDLTTHSEESPFHAITEDLRARIIDWKGHPISGLGPLQMYDLLSVRRDAIVREFFVYLFREAIICVVEEKKRGLGRLLSNAGVGDTGSLNGGNAGQQKGVLRLKGRIYIRHIKHVTDTSVAGEMSLTIDMEDERLDSFILIFRERSSLETWKNHIQRLVTAFQQQNGFASPRQASPRDTPALEEFGGGGSKAARIRSGSTGTTSYSNEDSLLSGPSSRSTTSSTSHSPVGALDRTIMAQYAQQHRLATLEEGDEPSRYSTPIPVPLVTPHLPGGPSNSLTPLTHPPLDLILVISIPPPHVAVSVANLKYRVIKSSLDFVITSLSPKDRLSLVTFEVGVGGKVRKTPFLNIGKPMSRTRLSKFVDDMGSRRESDHDEFLVRGSQDEKTDVVTAVNHGRSYFSRKALRFTDHLSFRP